MNILFVIPCADKKDHIQVLLDNRQAHLKYLKSLEEKLFAAGPTLSQDEVMNGAIIISDQKNLVESESFVANDPYNKAGLFANVMISAWKKVLP